MAYALPIQGSMTRRIAAALGLAILIAAVLGLLITVHKHRLRMSDSPAIAGGAESNAIEPFTR